MNPLVAFVGFKSSGKNTAAQVLIDQFGYAPLSFADAIKDSLASIFCWPRVLLEGISDESRVWREQVDAWWAERLGIAGFSPRWAMAHYGSEIMRKHFNPAVWVLNVERRIILLEGRPIVIIDGRFPNEIALARRYGGLVGRIKRGPDPEWMPLAARANGGDVLAQQQIDTMGIHLSERAWVGCPVDLTLENNGRIDALHQAVIKWLDSASRDESAQ